MRLALYHPEIPQNTGTLLRLGSCLKVPVDIIEPCGFVLSDRRMQRAGMDYIELANYTRHESYSAFLESAQGQRIVLITTNAETPYCEFEFTSQDVLVLGCESSGLPKEVEAQHPHQVKIPMIPERRSLNIATAAAMVLGEVLRQTSGFPG